MRLALKLFLVLLVVGVLAAGLLPPLFEESHLRDDAKGAAQAGAAVILKGGVGINTVSVNQAVQASLAPHHGLKLVSMKVSGGVVTVVVAQNVHSFMSRTPGLEHWFHLTVTESASAYGTQ